MTGIQVEEVSKKYRRYTGNHSITFQEAFLRGFRGHSAGDTFWALRDVSFAVAAGEMVGVIGRNGAGKSSLLRLVGGVGRPDQGNIRVDGRLGALIELGAGFHPDLTGRENVYMNGVISGLSRRKVAAILDDIVAFAELEEFVDSPLRTYSSGMQLRLAFSVAVFVKPEVLLVDEVLAVGDLGFQRKCIERIRALRAAGAAILFVTHDLVQASQECDRVLWLESGQVVGWGPAAEVVDAYRENSQRAMRQRTPPDHADQVTSTGGVLKVNHNRFGSMDVELNGVRLLNGAGTMLKTLSSGDALAVEMDWRARSTDTRLAEVIFGVGIFCADGQVAGEVFSPPSLLPGSAGHLRLDFERLDLAAGEYFVEVGAYPADWSCIYDYHSQVYSLKVESAADGKGPLRPPHRWLFEKS
jgi:lipopolysaccharide transport system ATP-binding protein